MTDKRIEVQCPICLEKHLISKSSYRWKLQWNLGFGCKICARKRTKITIRRNTT